MFSSSPSSSTGSPRLTRSHPVGPPRRTYARRNTKPIPKEQEISDTESEEEEQLETGRGDGKGGAIRARPKVKGDSQSSPSLGPSSGPPSTILRNGSRSSSRLGKTGSQAKESSLTTAPSRSVIIDDAGDSDCITATAGLEAQNEEEGRKESTKLDQEPVKSPPSPSPLASSTPTPTPTPKKRKAEPSDIGTPPRRSSRPTRSRSNTSQNGLASGVPAPRRRDVTPPRTALVAEPSTPTSSPRDYAHLFAAISPDPSVLSSPSRKRLIGQSQSSGAVLDSPSKLRRGFSHVFDSPGKSGPSTPTKLLGRNHSMPISPSKPVEDGDPSAMWIKPVEPEGQGSGGRAKRIYGRTRTVVAEDDDTVTDVAKLEEALSKESYASLRSRYEVNSEETTLSQAELSALIIARAPQSANDMRSKGENRRFMDETGYLLDGIEDESGTKGFRRASCVDILGNMQSEEWMSKLNLCGQTERVWSAYQGVRGEGDDIMDAVCLLALYLMINGLGGVEGVLRADAEGCIRFLSSLLKERNGVLDEKWTGKVTSLVERVRKVGRNIRRESLNTSTRHMASTILSSLAVNYGDLLGPVLRAEKVLGKTLKGILPEITALADRFNLVESGLSIVPHDDCVDLAHIGNALAVVDHMITASPEDRHDLSRHHAGVPLAILQALIAFTSIALDTSGKATRSHALGALSCLKVFANMSNVSPAWSRDIKSTEGALTAFARIIIQRQSISDSIGATEESPTEPVVSTGEDELLCLVLAIVTSAALVEEQLASALASLALNVECEGQDACFRSCECPVAEPFVNELARLYASFHLEISADAETEIMAAYLALLLSKIIKAAPSILTDIHDILPGDGTETKLGKIIASLRALDVYRSTLQRRLKAETGAEGVEWQEDGNEVKKAIDDISRLVDTY